ncbi:MAG: hypothetical protein Q8K15_04965 [Candidatus Omnitrophota bacterium]|nr:hypothetical protein [Candidatus Omnitrophota bacterium]
MRYFLFILLCFSLAGCTTIFKTKRLENQVTELQGVLLRKDQDIKLKEDKLKEKELEVNRLRKELEKFGVFQ